MIVQRRHKTQLILFVLLVFTYAYFYQSTAHNEAARLDQARAILDEHRLTIDSFRWNTADVAMVNVRGEDHVFPAKAPGSSLVAIVPMWLLQRVGHLFGMPEWELWHLIAYGVTILLVALPSALAALAMYDILKRMMGSRRNTPLLAVLAIWLGSILFPFSTLYFGHAQTAACVVGAFWLLFRFTSRKTLFLAGLLAGLAVVIEYPAIIAALALAVYVVVTRKRTSTAFFAGALVMGAVLIGYNELAFGRPFFTSYQALGNGSGFVASGLGFAGIHWPGFAQLISVLAQTLILPQRGLLFVNPILVLAIPGFFLWYGRGEYRREFWLVVSMAIALILFNACYGDSIIYWGGGASTGPRQLIMMLPFLAIPLAYAAQQWRGWFWGLLGLSVFIMLMATAVEPRIPYDYTNPVFQFFLPHFLDGQFGLNRDALFDPLRHGLVGHSTAVNLGGIVGLSGILQLIPLLIIWGVLGSNFKISRRLLVVFLIVVALLPMLYREAKGFPDVMSAGLNAQYWPNDTFEGAPMISRREQLIDNNWLASLPLSTPFTVRWTGTLHVKKAGTYVFFLESDDGGRLVIDGSTAIDDWGPHGVHRADKAVVLGAGAHALELGYHNSVGGGVVRFSWRPPGHPEETVPASVFVIP